MSNMPRAVTALIVTFNSSHVIADCLSSLSAAAGATTLEVVVVDNNSADDTVAVVRGACPQARVIETGVNGGYAAGINAGLRTLPVSSDVLVLNADARLAPRSIELLHAGLQPPSVGIIVPKLTTPDGRLHLSVRRDPTLSRAVGELILGGRRAGKLSAFGEIVADKRAYESPMTVDWATGAVMMIGAECRAAVGSWDESFFLYSEETDYCQRARKLGFRVQYEPRAVAVHVEGGAATPELHRRLVESKLALFDRDHSPLARAAYRAVIAVNEGTRALMGRRNHRSGLAGAIGVPPAQVSVSRANKCSGFVLFSAQDYWYHNRAHSDIQLARALSESFPVLLINSIGMRMPTPSRSSQVWRRILRKSRSISRALRTPEAAHPNLHVLSPISIPSYGSAVIRAVNAWFVRLQVVAALRWLGIRRPHILVTIPTAWNVIGPMQKASMIVNRSDKYSAFPEADTAVIESFERELLAHADGAMYVSHDLMEEERALVRSGEVIFLGHGVDFDRFASIQPSDMPSDIADLEGPRIGFFGGLHDYVVDFDLLERIAREFPHANLVLVGAATADMTRLTAHPNVRWLGARPYVNIPSYGIGFDVAIMPWLQSDWIQHCNPIKTKEYLALGVPVVSMFYPEAKYVEDVIAIATDHDQFIRLIREALDGFGVGSPQERRNKVRGDSWQGRARIISNIAERGSR